MPVIEDLGDGRSRVTVSYRDDDASDVWVIGGLAGADPADRRMRRAEDGSWTRSYELGNDVRTAYWFTTVAVPGSSRELLADPLNENVHVFAPNPDDPDDREVAVSLIELPDAEPLRWSLTRPGVPRGETTRHRFRSDLLGNTRSVFTYTPPAYDPARAYPLVVCFDGFAFTSETHVPLPTVLDNLIAAGSIPPVVALLPDSIDSATRTRELREHEPFVSFLTEELLPWAHGRLSFDDDPGTTLVAGASLGGLGAAFCGLRRPDVFGLILAQSGSFQHGLPHAFALAERLPLRFHLDVGLLETTTFGSVSLRYATLHLRDVLVAKGYDVSLREFPGGHDYFWWRETIADGLVALLG